MPIKIEVESTDTKAYQSKSTGKTYFKQVAYAYLFDRDGQSERYPRQIELIIPADGNMPRPYIVGEYNLSPESIKVDQYGSLELSFPKLISPHKNQKAA